MSATASLACANGHTDSPAGSRFCIRCGGALRPIAAPAPGAPPQRPACATCGGGDLRLPEKHPVCPDCRWLRPLAPGYAVSPSAFQWAEDGHAMQTLRSTPGLTSAARAVSDRVGRRWIESTFNAVRLGPTQLPEIWLQAVMAARLLGMPTMPDVHVSGERPWEAMTFGSDRSAFVILGSALAMNFRDDDLLFLLAREMGHCRAGHALWKTVIRFLVGEHGPRREPMAGGVVNAVSSALNPAKLVEGALELPLLAWARQAEITADRAGLLAVGDEAAARRVLLGWSLKNPALLKRINTDAWLAQQASDDADVSQLSELLTSATPYLTRRLKVLEAFARSPELGAARAVLQSLLPPAAPRASLRFVCPSCRTGMNVPKSALAGKDALPVRCPNKACARVAVLRRSVPRLPRPRVSGGTQLGEHGGDLAVHDSSSDGHDATGGGC